MLVFRQVVFVDQVAKNDERRSAEQIIILIIIFQDLADQAFDQAVCTDFLDGILLMVKPVEQRIICQGGDSLKILSSVSSRAVFH